MVAAKDAPPPKGASIVKISRAEAFLVDLEPETPRFDAIQSFVKQETIFVDLATDDGLTGTGYAYTIGTGGRAVLQLLREDLLHRLLGHDARQIEALWQDLFWSTHGTVVDRKSTRLNSSHAN